MKRFLSFLIASVVVLSFSHTTVFANNTHEQEKNQVDVIYTTNPNIQVSDPMNFSEMITYFANSKNISYEEALTFFDTPTQSYSSTYAPIKYRVFTVNLVVTENVYVPHLEFYCQTSENGNYWGILNVYSCELIRSYNQISKQFSGTVNFWLRNPYTIEYSVNGDFYENGTTSHTAEVGLNVDVGAGASISYSISYSSNHYKYFHIHQNLVLQH